MAKKEGQEQILHRQPLFEWAPGLPVTNMDEDDQQPLPNMDEEVNENAAIDDLIEDIQEKNHDFTQILKTIVIVAMMIIHSMKER